MLFQKKWGKKLEAYRREKGLSYRALGDEIGLSDSAVRTICQGGRRYLRDATADTLIAFLREKALNGPVIHDPHEGRQHERRALSRDTLFAELVDARATVERLRKENEALAAAVRQFLGL